MEEKSDTVKKVIAPVVEPLKIDPLLLESDDGPDTARRTADAAAKPEPKPTPRGNHRPSICGIIPPVDIDKAIKMRRKDGTPQTARADGRPPSRIGTRDGDTASTVELVECVTSSIDMIRQVQLELLAAEYAKKEAELNKELDQIVEKVRKYTLR